MTERLDTIDAALAGITSADPGAALALVDTLLQFDLSDPETKAELARPVAMLAIMSLTCDELRARMTEPDALEWLNAVADAP